MIIKLNKHIDNFTVIDNEFLNQKDLTWKAKGLLAYLLSLPKDWNINLEHLKSISSENITATRSAMNELINKGYVIRKISRDKNGKICKSIYHVIETLILAQKINNLVS